MVFPYNIGLKVKTVHLIRHAKSSWNDLSLTDVERPLNKRGRKACRLMAEPILRAGCNFDKVYCSIAQRAQMTIEGISRALENREIEWELDDALYTFSSHNLFQRCRELDDSLNDVVLVGHNPAMTEFCNIMGNRTIANLPTCGYAQLRFPRKTWESLSPGSAETVAFLTPKNIR